MPGREKRLGRSLGLRFVGLLSKPSENCTFSLVGLDLQKPLLYRVEHTGLYSHLVYADVRQLPLKELVFNFTLAFQILEHQTSKDADVMLAKIEIATQERQIIATPLCFEKQDLVEENPFQRCLSGCQPDFLGKEGTIT